MILNFHWKLPSYNDQNSYLLSTIPNHLVEIARKYDVDFEEVDQKIKK